MGAAVQDVLDRVAAIGGRLRAIDGMLEYVGPTEPLDADLRAAIRLHKAALVEAVRPRTVPELLDHLTEHCAHLSTQSGGLEYVFHPEYGSDWLDPEIAAEIEARRDEVIAWLRRPASEMSVRELLAEGFAPGAFGPRPDATPEASIQPGFSVPIPQEDLDAIFDDEQTPGSSRPWTSGWARTVGLARSGRRRPSPARLIAMRPPPEIVASRFCWGSRTTGARHEQPPALPRPHAHAPDGDQEVATRFEAPARRREAEDAAGRGQRSQPPGA